MISGGKPNRGGGPQGNNGYGNGDQDAPGGSGGNTNAENAEDSMISGSKPNQGGGPLGNNGYGNGDQDAPGGSGGNTNAENAEDSIISGGITTFQPVNAIRSMGTSSDGFEHTFVAEPIVNEDASVAQPMGMNLFQSDDAFSLMGTSSDPIGSMTVVFEPLV